MSQSRWLQEFQNHPFQEVWRALKIEMSETQVDDPTEANAVMELARLKRVISYVENILRSLDPELVPRSIWANFQTQVAHALSNLQTYNVDKNVSGLIAANDHADNLLSYVKPWMVTPIDAIDAVRDAAVNYSEALESQITDFIGTAQSAIGEIGSTRSKAASRLKGLVTTADKIDELAKEIFEAKGDQESLEGKLRRAFQHSQAIYSEIITLHTKMLVDQPDQKSINSLISEAEKRIVAADKSVANTISESEALVAELEVFNHKIFGGVNVRTGEKVLGLEQELQQRIEQIDHYETDQQKRHQSLFNKIEALLPGANSAGLASVYRTMKMSFNKPIQYYTVYFYCSLVLLGIGSLLLWVESFTLNPFVIQFVGIKPWEELLRGLLGRAAFFIPVVWLAIFSATRRSQYERLQQEYAHKEAFASSYDSYKKELTELHTDTTELQKALLEKAITAVAFNASSTLDGTSHVEKPPFLKFLDKADPELLKKLAELIVNKKPAS